MKQIKMKMSKIWVLIIYLLSILILVYLLSISFQEWLNRLIFNNLNGLYID
jgi:hypothetical protein